MEIYSQIAEELKKAKKITVVTGAGISVPSGIPDFRSSSGLYKGREADIPYYISLTHFRKDPDDFWGFYKDLLQIKLQDTYKPNEGHYFLAELEKMGKDVTIVTQNVDGLHQKAGSTNVIEIHGSAQRSTCPTCGTIYNLDYINSQAVPRCEKDNSVIKPGMVLFEEAIHGFEEAYQATQEADAFMVLGTSLQVGPVNQLPRYTRKSNVAKMIINMDPTIMDYLFEYKVHEEINSCFAKVKQYL